MAAMAKNVPSNYPEVVRTMRQSHGWTQAELAKQLAVTNVTISRWEKGRVEPSLSLWEKFMVTADSQTKPKRGFSKPDLPHAVDFLGDGLAVRAMVEGERLAYCHLANPAFATEVSKIYPLLGQSFFPLGSGYFGTNDKRISTSAAV